jgi:lysophospholipase L1-like esterase
VQNISKYHVFLFIAGVLGILFITSMLVPKGGWDVAGMKIKFLSSEYVFTPKAQEKKDISTIVDQVDISIVEDTVTIDQKKVFVPGKISYNINSATKVHFRADALAQLHTFFGELNSTASSSGKMHMLHFGDSQIEGDRMTTFIRQRIQQQFGGIGPGLVPAMNVYPTNSFIQTLSENFARYTCFGGEKLSNRQYGIMNSAARFTPEEIDSLDLSIKEAWIEIKPSTNTFANARQYKQVKMFYNSNTEKCLLEVYDGETLLRKDSLKRDGAGHLINLNFESTPQSLKLVFKGRKSPNITGFSLEGNSGIQVDNIAMRGSSGTFLHQVDKSLFSQQMHQLNTKLVIWQFGGNSVPYLKDSLSVENYASYYKSQLLALRRLKGDMAIVVIGPSDMSTLTEGFYESFPLLEYCVKKIKAASQEAGAGYWDLFEAMGGKNSMPAWVEKGLAGSDYIHFTPKGAKIASQLFYEALMAEYAKYMKK